MQADKLPYSEPIPSNWTHKHNFIVAIFLFVSMLTLLFSLDHSSFSVVEVTGERLKQLAWITGGSLLTGGFGLWLHSHRLKEIHGIDFKYDGRDDRVLTGLILGTALLFCCAWSWLLHYNESAPLKLKPQPYRLTAIKYIAGAQVELRQKPNAPPLKLELSGYKNSFFKQLQVGDRFELSLQPGRLGFAYLSYLAWQAPHGKAQQLWPRLRLLPSSAKASPH
jgi:hypothetical protein